MSAEEAGEQTVFAQTKIQMKGKKRGRGISAGQKERGVTPRCRNTESLPALQEVNGPKLRPINAPVIPSRCVLRSEPQGGKRNTTQRNTTRHREHVNEPECTSGAAAYSSLLQELLGKEEAGRNAGL